MALPKRRHSTSRSRKRRTHWKLKTSMFFLCPQCKTPKLPHRVCPVCGTYKGEQVVEIKEKKDKKKKPS